MENWKQKDLHSLLVSMGIGDLAEQEKFVVLEVVMDVLKLSKGKVVGRYALEHSKRLFDDKLPMKIVYKNECKFEVSDSVDITRLADIWGVLLSENVVLSIGSAQQHGVLQWEDVRKYVENLELNGKKGQLPNRNIVENWSREKSALLRDTLTKLSFNKVATDKQNFTFWGCEVSEDSAIVIDIERELFRVANKSALFIGRIAVSFE